MGFQSWIEDSAHHSEEFPTIGEARLANPATPGIAPFSREIGSLSDSYGGLWYVDEYRRTDAGWRISRRIEEKSYVFNMP
ncbi:MAG: nuclear transport factor 2 family protein [Myxococcales bacterium]|nr:nuclear transport factor 2 family protein [Myxococcales bacterium]